MSLGSLAKLWVMCGESGSTYSQLRVKRLTGSSAFAAPDSLSFALCVNYACIQHENIGDVLVRIGLHLPTIQGPELQGLR